MVEILVMSKEPKKALQPTAAGPGVFDVDMKLDCRVWIWESGSAAVAELAVSGDSTPLMRCDTVIP